MNEKRLENLPEENRRKIEEMALEKPIQAIQELRNLTHCSISDGKNWVDEVRQKREEAHRKNREENLPPCPYCGEKLRTYVAKQCRFCKRDWHDENNIKLLK